LDKDRNPVPVEITHIPQQCKQGMVSKFCANVKALSSQKKKGEKVGTISFKTDGTSIFLKQYGAGKSYEVVSKHTVKLAGLKKPVPVRGLDQLEWISNIDPEFEFSSATLDRDKVGDYFFHITLWVDKAKWFEYKNSKDKIEVEQVGIDFGCETTITTSDGQKLTPIVNESERLKSLQDKKTHQVKHSNRWWKTILAIRKECRHSTNQKDDIANKEASKILRRTNEVIIQDEQIANWQKTGHGKKIQHSIHGRMIDRLKSSPKTVVLDKFIPTTKLCNKCGHIQDMPQSVRTYECEHCGAVEDRDFHGAENMVFIRNNFENVIVGPDRPSFNRADFD
jgi:putative transposase